MELLLLALVFAGCLFLIPLGLPGLWVMLAAGFAYDLLMPGPDPIGIWNIAGATVLAVLAEVAEFSLAGKYVRKYGGSRRAGWGAILGGMVGAFMGVPVPIIGSVIGAFAGAFAGALLLEYLGTRNAGAATRVAWGALVGRVVAAALKVGVGVAIAAWLLIAASV
jgi:uncharacterized protein YqgC (DUF456 family)